MTFILAALSAVGVWQWQQSAWAGVAAYFALSWVGYIAEYASLRIAVTMRELMLEWQAMKKDHQ